MGDITRSSRCRICNHRSFDTIMTDVRTRLGETYGLKQCKNCSFISTDPLPSPEILKKYYAGSYRQGENAIADRYLSLFYKIRMRGLIKEIHKMLPPSARILDWGAGDGALVRLLADEGFESYGIDAYSTDINHDKLFNATIESVPFSHGFFDAITCFHVLEHIDQPVLSLNKAFSLLKPGGIIIIEVPNIDSISFRLFQKRWHPLDLPVHVNHFNPSVLRILLEESTRSRVFKTKYFSPRHAPNSFLVSLLPSLSPPKIRAKHAGKFPASIMATYLVLQIMIYPYIILEAILGRGEIIQMYARKQR